MKLRTFLCNRLRSTLTSTSRKRPLLIGVIHLPALPGTPRNKISVDRITKHALHEAELYLKNGITCLQIENMHDIPYCHPRLHGNSFDPVITASMAVIGSQLRKNVLPSTPIGIQILAGANREALAVAKAADLDFIRAEGFVFSHVADEGWIDACAGDLLRYRRFIDAGDSEKQDIINKSDVMILCDIKKKHSAHAVTSDVNLAETVMAAKFFLADGVIVTGTSTGSPTNPSEVVEAVESAGPKLPVFVGSGITPNNVENYKNTSGLIVGSWFKKDGRWDNAIEPDRIRQLVDKMNDIWSE